MEQRKKNLEDLTRPELINKKDDILQCLISAKNEDSKEVYRDQLNYVDQILYTTEQLVLTLRDGGEGWEG